MGVAGLSSRCCVQDREVGYSSFLVLLLLLTMVVSSYFWFYSGFILLCWFELAAGFSWRFHQW